MQVEVGSSLGEIQPPASTLDKEQTNYVDNWAKRVSNLQKDPPRDVKWVVEGMKNRRARSRVEERDPERVICLWPSVSASHTRSRPAKAGEMAR
jgi:hypothetical protein